MSYCDDLIDLSVDSNFSKTSTEDVILSPQNATVSSYTDLDKRFSFDNNPFDCALRKTELQNDPFEIVAQQIENNRLANVPRSVDVQTVNLLGLDESEIVVDDQPDLSNPQSCSVTKNDHEPVELVNKTESAEGVDRGEGLCQPNLSINKISEQNEHSPKVSNVFSGFNIANGDIRTQLLKLSVSGSPHGSMLRRNSKTSEEGSDKNSSSGSLYVNGGSFNDSCDDINAIKPNWVDSETENDSDLEQLKIPMLKQIDDDSEKEASLKLKRDLNDETKKVVEENDKAPRTPKNKIDLQMIRERVKRHKSGKSSPQDVDDLISSMKHVVSECSDEHQRLEAIHLLENLSTLLSKKSPESKEDNPKVECSLEVPQPMVRQGTFDLDKSKSPNNFNENEIQKTEDADNIVLEPEQVAPCPGNQEMPGILEQLGRLLGNQNINVLQTNITSAENSLTAPTYIVLMGAPNAPLPTTPMRQNTQILINNPTSPEFEGIPRNRSQSLSLHDKAVKRRPIATPSSPSVFNTPTRPQTLKRRSTISYSPSTSLPSANRKEYPTPDTSKQSNLQRRLSLHSDRNAVLPKMVARNTSSIGVESNPKSLKFKASEYSRRTIGPLKATVPVKKVLQMATTPTNLTLKRGAMDSKLLTSTPIVTSTSSSSKSPTYKTNTSKNKFHSPSLSATPNMKASAKSTLTSLQRRRSLTDSKSPMLSTNSSSSKTSASLSQFVRRSTLGIPHKNTIPSLPRSKENACPK